MSTQNNIGFLYYKGLYKAEGGGLKIIAERKKQILNRTLLPAEQKFALETTDFFKLYTTYPGLTTGAGMPHGIKEENDDFKIGFYFDHTAGLPLLPGSSVKGVLRSVFPDIKKNSKDDGTLEFVFEKKTDEEKNRVKACWIQALLNGLKKDGLKEDYYKPMESVTPEQKEALYALVIAIFEGVKDHTKSDPREKFYSIYNRDIFYDATITGAGKEEKIVGTDSITPHIRDGEPYHKAMLKNPIPLLFLKVLPNVEFTFHFSLTDNGLPKEDKLKLFKHILLTIGAGAKTNVGYGQFSPVKPDRFEENYEKPRIEKGPVIVKHQADELPETDQTTRFSEVIPPKAASALVKGATIPAVVSDIADNYNYFEFRLNDALCRCRKKSEKNPDLKVNDNVTFEINSNYQFGGGLLNFKVKKQ